VLGGETAVRDCIFVQYDHQPSPGSGIPTRVHTIIDGRFRLSRFHGEQSGELYDLAADPGEFENVWNDPARACAFPVDRDAYFPRNRACRPRVHADAPRLTRHAGHPLVSRRLSGNADSDLGFSWADRICGMSAAWSGAPHGVVSSWSNTGAA
jgi:hypothetical protein